MSANLSSQLMSMVCMEVVSCRPPSVTWTLEGTDLCVCLCVNHSKKWQPSCATSSWELHNHKCHKQWWWCHHIRTHKRLSQGGGSVMLKRHHESCMWLWCKSLSLEPAMTSKTEIEKILSCEEDHEWPGNPRRNPCASSDSWHLFFNQSVRKN